MTYIPYAFSGGEIHSFFKAYDNLPDIPKTRSVLIRRITAPVFFRLPYNSGIRTTEVRLLECVDVGVGNGILNTRYSEGHDQHYITLRDSMADLMRRYDGVTQEWLPSREYLFPTSGGTVRLHAWVEKNLRRAWVEVSNDQTATAHASRHHYAITNVNHWIGNGSIFDGKLTRLSKNMGHTTLESTWYYCSVVPGLFDIVLKKIGDGLNELVPEVIS